jgi:hypothetical protein
MGASALPGQTYNDLIHGVALPNCLIYKDYLLENEKIKSKIHELIQRATFNQAPHLVGAQLYWCIRRMGHDEFVLIIEP